MKDLKISVIIPAYNASPFIADTLNSVFDQEQSGVEIIVVDDGSTDDTARIVAEHAGRLQLLRQENQGESLARNRGIKEATGDVIVFLDSDDCMSAGTIAAVVEELTAHPETDMLYGQVRFFSEKDALSQPSGRDLGSQGDILPSVIQGAALAPGQVYLRRACMQRVGVFREDIRYGEDWDYLLRVARIASCRYFPYTVLEKRVHPGMQSLESNRPDILQQRIDILHSVFGETYDREVAPLLTRRVLAVWLRAFGFSLAKQGDHRRARRVMWRSLGKNPFQPPIYLWLAVSYLRRLRKK